MAVVVAGATVTSGSGSRSTASSRQPRMVPVSSSSASHSSQVGTHGWDHAVMPIGDGSAPTNIEWRSSWSARSAFSNRPADGSASAWVDPS